jgi:cytosine permease
LINLLMAVTLLGWYGVTAALFGQAVSQSLFDYLGLSVAPGVATLVGSLFVVVVTIFGFKALEKLSLWMVPLMMLFLAVLLYQAWGYQKSSMEEPAAQEVLSLQQAISVTVGGYIVGATLIPDLSRYSVNVTHSVLAVMASLGIGLPLVLVIPALAGDAVGQSDLVNILIGLGLGLPAVLMIVLATWSTNMTNLYSSSLAVAAVLNKVDKWKITLMVGFCCTLIASMNLTDRFIDFLLLLGVLIPPIAGIYVVDFFVVNRKAYERGEFNSNPGIGKTAMVSWLLGALMGWLVSQQYLQLTSVASCDSILTSTLCYWVLKCIEQRLNIQQPGIISDDSI